MDVIIYKQDNGNVAVVVPTAEALAHHTIMDIAIKDVPGPKTVYDVPTGVFVEYTEDEILDGLGEPGETYEVMGPRVIRYPFKIMDASDLPDTPQETWVVDDADLTDGFGGESNEFNH